MFICLYVYIYVRYRLLPIETILDKSYIIILIPIRKGKIYSTTHNGELVDLIFKIYE